MIVSFLCLFGPGALTCLIQRRTFVKDAIEQPALLILLEAVACSMLIMAITVLILQPVGEAEILILPNGMPFIRYSSLAMFLSVILSLVFGLWGRPVGRIFRFIHKKSTKRKYVVYMTAIIVAIGLLAHPMDSSGHLSSDMKISTMPIKINGVLYNGEDPLYVSGESQYFISYRALADGLGLDYGIKSSGLFFIEYYLGNDTFTVNRMTPGKDFYMKEQKLYMNLDYVCQSGLFSGIQIKNMPVLADGSSREMIYIDNYSQRFDVGWMENVSGYEDKDDNGTAFVSSIDSFKQKYDRGCRMFVVDLQTAVRTWMTKSIHLLKEYSDAYLMIEVNYLTDTDVTEQLELFVKKAENIEAEVLARTILQVSSKKMFDIVTDVFSWNCVVYHIQDDGDFSEKDFIDFAYKEGIRVITGNFESTRELLVHELLELDMKIFRYK